MRYTVVWRDEALDELATAWAHASDREAVTEAAGAVDVRLAEDPHLQGNEVHEGLLLLLEPPLRVLYEVLPEDRLARVLTVGFSQPLTAPPSR